MIAVRFGPIEDAKAARLLLYDGTAPLQFNYILEHEPCFNASVRRSGSSLARPSLYAEADRRALVGESHEAPP